jgi:hypothetical protein
VEVDSIQAAVMIQPPLHEYMRQMQPRNSSVCGFAQKSASVIQVLCSVSFRHSSSLPRQLPLFSSLLRRSNMFIARHHPTPSRSIRSGM